MNHSDRQCGPRRSLRPHGQGGQILLMYLIFLLPMTMVLLSVFNVGMTVSEKMKVQNAADNAAYSAATWEARYMNLSAYITRAMVANLDTVAALDAIWSTLDATDGFLQLARRILDAFFGIGEVLAVPHEIVHLANNGMHQVIGGGKKNYRAGYFLEGIVNNTLYSNAQQLLYVLNQVGRQNVIQEIAHGVDGNTEYFLPAEAYNALELSRRRQWQGTDETNGYRLTTERSLNQLSNGGSFRDAENFLPGPLRTIHDIVNAIPCFGINIGPHGYDGPGFNHETGGSNISDEVTIVQNDKLYQRDHNGVSVKFDCIVEFSFGVGHMSDDAFNLPQQAGLDVPHIADDEHDHSDWIDDNVECSSVGGALSTNFGSGSQFQQLSQLNDLCQHADPTRTRFENPLLGREVNTSTDPDHPSWMTCSAVQSQMQDATDNLVSGAGMTSSSNPCATIYEWNTPLKDVKLTTYVQDDSVVDGRRIEGPTLFVYLRKPFGKLPVFRGLGLGNNRNIEAYSFAKVYYTQRVGNIDGTQADGQLGNPMVSNKETAFNPFWAARLERPRPLGLNVLLH